MVGSIPAFLYGYKTWGQISEQEYSDLEKVKTFLKYIQGLKNHTHYEIIRGLLGWHTAKGLIDKSKVLFVY